MLSPETAAKTFTTNTLAQFTTLSTMLPYLLSSPTGAHIITISSILSHLSPARLSDYSASKAAISSLHNTLYHELLTHPDRNAFSRVKTLLVEPGMLSTQLFSDITKLPWYAHFFGPVLEAKDVAKEILRVVERGEGGVIRMPFYAKCVPMLGVLPGSLQRVVRWWSGIDRAIVGREKRA
jgi:short-subunit dehydrogenase